MKGALLTWKTSKVFLAALAVGGAVGVSQVPRNEPAAAPPPAEAVAARAVLTLEPTELQAPARRARGHRFDAARRSAARDPAPEQAQSTPAAPAAPASPALEETPARALRAAPAASFDTYALARDAPRSHRSHYSWRVQRVSAGSDPRPSGASHDSHASGSRGSPPREIALIRGALTSLRDGAPGRALALLDEHAKFYPSGAFMDERRGLRVLALCAAGRYEEGEREREAFLDKAGSSPIAVRVRRACARDRQ